MSIKRRTIATLPDDQWQAWLENTERRQARVGEMSLLAAAEIGAQVTRTKAAEIVQGAMREEVGAIKRLREQIIANQGLEAAREALYEDTRQMEDDFADVGQIEGLFG